ncbi:hypothetical protein ONZ45_g5324 [Pleurotus djamor]|nr:hypothetical protein ONZ45_g5324 [Pleurotus djamor]
MSTPSPKASELSFERALYIGNHIACVTYGFSLAMLCMLAYLYYVCPNNGQHSRRRLLVVLYGLILLVVWTLSRFCNVALGMQAWINHRSDEGGPATYLVIHQRDAANVAGTCASILGNWLIDGLLLLRCYHFWDGSTRFVMPRYCTLGRSMIIVPTLLFLASIVAYESARPDATFFQGKTISFAVPYFTITVALNITLTLLIIIPIILANPKPKSPPRRSSVKAAVMLVESATLASVPGLIFIVLYAIEHPAAFALLQIWGSFCVLASFFIIFRVALGRTTFPDSPNSQSIFELTPVESPQMPSEGNFGESARPIGAVH